jgi:hypothetical protein
MNKWAWVEEDGASIHRQELERKGQAKEEVSRGLDMGIGHEGLLWKGQGQRRGADTVRIKGVEEEKKKPRLGY